MAFLFAANNVNRHSVSSLLCFFFSTNCVYPQNASANKNPTKKCSCNLTWHLRANVCVCVCGAVHARTRRKLCIQFRPLKINVLIFNWQHSIYPSHFNRNILVQRTLLKKKNKNVNISYELRLQLLLRHLTPWIVKLFAGYVAVVVGETPNANMHFSLNSEMTSKIEHDDWHRWPTADTGYRQTERNESERALTADSATTGLHFLRRQTKHLKIKTM